MYFHQPVKTPNGPGLVQGINYQQGSVLVSHRPEDIPADMLPQTYKPLWVLRWYPLQTLTDLNPTKDKP